jgi:hypothetical protein
MEYELWLYRQDGRLSAVAKTQASGKTDAEAQAHKLLGGDIRRISIWCDGVWIQSLVQSLAHPASPEDTAVG